MDYAQALEQQARFWGRHSVFAASVSITTLTDVRQWKVVLHALGKYYLELHSVEACDAFHDLFTTGETR